VSGGECILFDQDGKMPEGWVIGKGEIKLVFEPRHAEVPTPA